MSGSDPCDYCGCDPCRCGWDDMRHDDCADDAHVDVCQNCGGYFEWSASLTAAWRKYWSPSGCDIQPQRCHRCIVDECWIEGRE